MRAEDKVKHVRAIAWCERNRATVRFFNHTWRDNQGKSREDERVAIRVGMVVFEGDNFLEVATKAMSAPTGVVQSVVPTAVSADVQALAAAQAPF